MPVRVLQVVTAIGAAVSTFCFTGLGATAAAVTIGAATPVAAHPISVTEANVFVSRTQAIVRIQFFAEDLMLFHGLEPDDQDVISADDLRRGLDDHRGFLLEKVTLRDARGEAMPGTVTDVQPFEIPIAGIPTTELMSHTATIQLVYSFPEPPEFITLQQDISDENFIFPSEMKLTLHQSGTDLTYTDSLKPGASVTLRFDWSGEVVTEDASDEEWNAWFEKQREATLGITSYSSVYSFIYIEPAEIRHEVLIPLATVATFLPLKHRDAAFVDVDEQEGVREEICRWLADVNPTTINGVAVLPEFTRIDFYGLDLKDFAQQAEQRRVSLANGRIGIILTYRPEADSVREAALCWNRFHAGLRKVESVVFAFPDELRRFEFSRFNPSEENIFKWSCAPKNLPAPIEAVVAEVPPTPTLRVPWLSLACLVFAAGAFVLPGRRSRIVVAAASLVTAVVVWRLVGIVVANPWTAPPQMSASDGDALFRRLHRGMYRALDFGSENQIFSALSKTVDGQLLEDVYLPLRESLEIRDQGGAVSRVRSVEYPEPAALSYAEERVPWPGFQIRAKWVVAGTVEHWGHIHERQNQFEALFTVKPRDGEWKICEMIVEGQNQLSARTRLRKF